MDLNEDHNDNLIQEPAGVVYAENHLYVLQWVRNNAHLFPNPNLYFEEPCT